MTKKLRSAAQKAIGEQTGRGNAMSALLDMLGQIAPVTVVPVLGTQSPYTAAPLDLSMLVLLIEDTTFPGPGVSPIVIKCPPVALAKANDTFTVKTIGSQFVDVDGNGAKIEGVNVVNLNQGGPGTDRAITMVFCDAIGVTSAQWQIVWDYKRTGVGPLSAH